MIRKKKNLISDDELFYDKKAYKEKPTPYHKDRGKLENMLPSI